MILRRARRFDFEFLFSLASRVVASNGATVALRRKIPTRIRFADSAKKPPFTNGGAQKRPHREKFFVCQNSRLRVRARRFNRLGVSRRNARHIEINQRVNNEYICGTSAFYNLDNRRRRVRAHYSNAASRALRSLRCARGRRTGIASSTLP
jgi:hypothetical protein